MANRLSRRYDTRNPFELAKAKGITVLYCDLASITGYYIKIKNQKIIYINTQLSDKEQEYTCAHELGHALLHSASNTPFMHTATNFIVNKFEIEANKFAIQLLYPDDVFMEYCNCTYYQVSQILNIPVELVEYKFSTINSTLGGTYYADL